MSSGKKTQAASVPCRQTIRVDPRLKPEHIRRLVAKLEAGTEGRK